VIVDSLVLIAVGAGLAWANGANDVSKGIATLVGSGVTDYRRAVAWGALWTGVGGLLGALLSGAMLSTFGSGLMAEGFTPTFAAALGTLLCATTWVLLATWTRLPVSTTHAIVGSLIGVTVLSQGGDAMRWSVLVDKIALPLLLSPFLALGLTWLLLRLLPARTPAAAAGDPCLCATVQPTLQVGPGGHAVLGASRLVVVQAPAAVCAVEQPSAVRLTLGRLHWLTSGATSLARGMNDGPKIVALSLAAGALSRGAQVPVQWLFAVVSLGMVGGSLVAGRRVTQVLAEGVTPMDDQEGFVANLMTAGLVTAGAVFGLPMSTTHVATGAIFGAGVRRGSLDWRALRQIAAAWVVTLPAAAALGGLCWWVIEHGVG